MQDNYMPYAVRIVSGLVIVISSVLLYLDTETWRFLFPVVFFLSSVICTFDGILLIRRTNGNLKANWIYTIPIVIGAALFVFGVLSVLVIFFRR